MKEKDNIKYIGGSRIGSRNLTIPFASLIISEEKLELNNTGFQNLIFYPQDLVNIEEVYYFPWIAQGIKIKHKISGYDKNIIFWSYNDPKKIIQSIQNKGLLRDKKLNTEKLPSKRSTSLRKEKFAISPIVIISVFVLILFGAVMLYNSSTAYDNYYTLEKSSKIHLEVRKKRIDHGTAFLNNKLIIPVGTKLVSDKPDWFKIKNQPIIGSQSHRNPSFTDLNEPFLIIKNANTFDLQVVKYEDTLTFELPDPNYKDPNDPTFKDLYHQLFKD
ncbi:hypothetical protein [Salegentibacter sediminis]|uniref:hypothetical protein n=1 Tax=Salegentibacter sediminis TaxID=1930251 RepID=UPI0009C157D4|nr:hypothetical protein [Salegentibacter sediminis]